METQELDSIKMKTMQEIANSNLLIDSMKAELIKLEEDKENFFKLREEEVMTNIKRVVNESQALLEHTKSNYDHVHEFYSVLTSFSDYLKDGQAQLGEAIEDFNREAKAIMKTLDERSALIAHERKQMDAEKSTLDGQRNQINGAQVQLQNDQRLLFDQQETLKRSIDRLKAKKI